MARLAPARILHLLPDQGVSGLTRAVIELVRHERMDGAADELVLFDRPLDVERDFMAPATPAHFIGAEGSVRAASQRFAGLVSGREARRVHVHGAEALLVARGLLKRPSCPVVATLYAPPPALGLLGRRRLAGALRAVDRLVVPSPALAAPWAELGRSPEVVLPGVDVQRFHPYEPSETFRVMHAEGPNTLLLGTILGRRGAESFEPLVAAVRERNSAGRSTALVAVGDGPGAAELRDRFRGDPAIHVRRRVRDAPGFLSSLDAFVLHRAGEAVPLSMVEALLCGKPAIVAAEPLHGVHPAEALAPELVKEGLVAAVPLDDAAAMVAAFDACEEPDADGAHRVRTYAVEAFGLHRLRAELDSVEV